MTYAIVLACGNSLRGDDAIGVQIAQSLTTVSTTPTLKLTRNTSGRPKLAGPIGRAELVIFVDASGCLATGELRVECIEPKDDSMTAGGLTHSCYPAELLALAWTLCGKCPQRSFLATIADNRSNIRTSPLNRCVARYRPL
jgi:hydrogenase maturation protease